MRKAKLQFDIGKLNTENIPKLVGNDGDDPIVRHLKELHARDPEKAQRHFERLHKQLSKRRGFEWMDKVKKPDK